MTNQQNFQNIFSGYPKATQMTVELFTKYYKEKFEARFDELQKEDPTATVRDAAFQVVQSTLDEVNADIDQLIAEASKVPDAYRSEFPRFRCEHAYNRDKQFGLDMIMYKGGVGCNEAVLDGNVFKALADVFAMRDYIKEQHAKVMKPYKVFDEWYERFHALRHDLRFYGATLTDAAPEFLFEYYDLETMKHEERRLGCNDLCYRFVINYLDKADKFHAQVEATKLWAYYDRLHQSNKTAESSENPPPPTGNTVSLSRRLNPNLSPNPLKSPANQIKAVPVYGAVLLLWGLEDGDFVERIDA